MARKPVKGAAFSRLTAFKEGKLRSRPGKKYSPGYQEQSKEGQRVRPMLPEPQSLCHARQMQASRLLDGCQIDLWLHTVLLALCHLPLVRLPRVRVFLELL